MATGSLIDDFKESYSFHVNLFRIVGYDLYRDNSGSGYLRDHWRSFAFVCMWLPMFFGQILYVVLGNAPGTGTLEIVNAGVETIITFQGLVKIMVIIKKKQEIQDMINEITELWPTSDTLTDEQMDVYKTWIGHWKYGDKICFRIALTATIMFSVVPLTITMLSMMSDGRTIYIFPLRIYFLCWINSNYVYALFYTIVFGLFTCVHSGAYLPFDFLIATVIFGLSLLLRLLQLDVENIVASNDENEEDFKTLRKCIIKHQKLISLTQKLNKIYELVLFFRIIASSLSLCFFIFLSVMIKGSILRNLTALLSVFFTMFTMCFMGQLLSDTSAGMADAAYNCDWYKKSPKFRRYILFIIARAQIPCVLTSMGFFRLDISMFSKILSTSYSSLSLLNQMYQDIEL